MSSSPLSLGGGVGVLVSLETGSCTPQPQAGVSILQSPPCTPIPGSLLSVRAWPCLTLAHAGTFLGQHFFRPVKRRY